MLKNISSVLVWSQNYRQLANWYQEKLGLTPLEELHHPQDTGVGFQFDKYFATFYDLDNNLLQLIGDK